MPNTANAVSDIELVIAYGTQIVERVRPLMEGDVRIEGCVARYVPLAPGEMLIRSFEDPEFNLAELSLSNYVTRTVKGDCPYFALPIHISRSFRHGDIYIRTDRGIEKPGDLRGKKVGITEYQHTAHVWIRGMLADEYQVDASELLWISGQLDKGSHPLDPHAFVPPSVHYERLDPGITLSEALESGLIDAIVSPQAPSCFSKGVASIARLFQDTRTAEEAYYRKTGIFPILHVMGIRPTLVNQYPSLAERVCQAFLAAKDIANARSLNKSASQGSFLGNDLCPYGFDANTRKTIETFLRYHARQGLSPAGTSLKTLYPSADIFDAI